MGGPLPPPPKYRDLCFEDLPVGAEFATPARTVTEADIVNYTGVSWDAHPLHSDESYASRARYGGRIAQGLLILSMVSGLRTLSGLMDRSQGLLGVEWAFRRPVRIQDTIRVLIRVAEARRASRGDSGVVTFATQVLNQRDEVVQEGRTTHMFACRNAVAGMAERRCSST